jgi:polyisoprenoid-binding protein YceI
MMRGRRVLWIGVTAALVVVLAGGFAVWYFVFRDTSPPAADIERAAQSVTTTTGSTGGSTTGRGSAGLDGTWTVSRSIGKFSDFTSSYAGYRVQEQLAGVGAKTAVGRTPDVSGSMTIAGTSATAVSIQVNMAALQSDESQRDDQMRMQGIETARFPTASFTLASPIQFGTVPADGVTVKVQASGTLQLHGVTKPVMIPLAARVVSGVIVVTGQLEVAFADYNIRKPSSFKVLSIDDHGVMELQLFFAKK